MTRNRNAGQLLASLIVPAMLLLFCAACGGGNGQPDPPDNEATISQAETVTGSNGAVANIPAGSTVTSDSVSNGSILFSSSAVSQAVLDTFTATRFGSVAFGPSDCVFDRAVSVSVPAGSATGEVEVYRYNDSSVSAVPGWTSLGKVNVSGGTATVSTTRFGSFVAGSELEVSMPELTVTVPSGLKAGDSASWQASWSGGTAPYSIEWNFGGGADPNTAQSSSATSPDSRSVVMLNSTTAAKTYTYNVTVLDDNGNGDSVSGSFTVAPLDVEPEPFKLTLFHNNDGESQLLNAGSEELPDSGNLSSFGGAANFITKLNELRSEAGSFADASVTVSSGDNFLAGAEFNASLQDGTYYDALVLDAIGYDAICLGNHDFDFGPDVLADFIGEFSSNVPYLSSNLDYSDEPDLQALVGDRLFKSVTVEKGGRKIGIVGATTELLNIISSPRGVSEAGYGREFSNPRNVSVLSAQASIQAEVDSLQGQGVDIIILISHMQGISEDEALISTLRGIDVAVAGGGDELLANGDSSENLIPGDEPVAGRSYPVILQDADGRDIPVVTTPGNYKYVGQLTVEFNDAGEVTGVDADHSGLQRVANSDYPDAVVGNAAIEGSVSTPVSNSLAALAANVIGTTEVPLNGRRGGWDDVNDKPSIVGVRNSETNLGNLDADALLWQANELAGSFSAPLADVAFQNGGGMRNDAIIEPGNITELDTFDINAFPNFVTILEGVTHSTLRDILESAVNGVQGTSGGFLQVSGLRFVYDKDGDPYVFGSPGSGTRVQNAWFRDGTQFISDGIVLNPGTKINLATIDFLARGGDGSPFEGDKLYTLGVSYQQALRNYIEDGLGGVVSAEQYPYEGEDGDMNILPAERRIQTVNPGGWSIDYLSTFDTGLGAGSAEIVTYDPYSRRIFLTNAGAKSVSVVDYSDPATPVDAGSGIDTSSYGSPTSCVAWEGYVAVSIAADPETDPGVCNIYDAMTLALVSSNPTGVLPDNVVLTNDHRLLLTANEGQPSDDWTIDPEGSVTVIDVTGDLASPVVTQIPFTGLNAGQAAYEAAGVRVFGIKQPGDVPSNLAEDLEPEYIAIAPDNSMAWVACQENNALLEIDLSDYSITNLYALGTKDWSTGGPMLDVSDRDGPGDTPSIKLGNWPVKTFYMPDTVKSFAANGVFYTIGANEGDSRDYSAYSEEARAKDLDLDDTLWPDEATLLEDGMLGRFKVTLANGDTDNDGDYDEIYGYGGRSFSIWNSGSQVYDSGDEFEQYLAANYASIFNMNDGDISEFDARSDDKGCEPEGLCVGAYRGTTFGFIGLERQGGMFIYDISNPASASRIDYVTTNPDGTMVDIAPEGFQFIPADMNPYGKPLVLYACEDSGTVVSWVLNVTE
ncbi:choice-of-anchor I family protein [bacterium]|nr:choice-of-anchor I family protein [bacterium]